jgi:hypothetical protein
MFQGNIYFPLPLSRAADLFTSFDAAVEQGLFSSPYGQDDRLWCFDEESHAIAAGKQFYAEQGQSVPGALNTSPVFAVIHIGPIAPQAVAAHTQNRVGISRGLSALVITPEGLARVAQIVRVGSFAWNRVDMTMKLVTL